MAIWVVWVLHDAIGDNVGVCFFLLLGRGAQPDVLYCSRILVIVLVLGVFVRVLPVWIEDNLSNLSGAYVPAEAKPGLLNDLGGVRFARSCHSEKGCFLPQQICRRHADRNTRELVKWAISGCITDFADSH